MGKNKGIQEQPRLVLKVKKSQIGNHWLKTEHSEKSNKCQRSNNFKKRSKQTKMKMRFIRNSLNISCKENNGSLNTENGTKLFVGNALFQDLFSEMTIDTNKSNERFRADERKGTDTKLEESHV